MRMNVVPRARWISIISRRPAAPEHRCRTGDWQMLLPPVRFLPGLLSPIHSVSRKNQPSAGRLLIAVPAVVSSLVECSARSPAVRAGAAAGELRWAASCWCLDAAAQVRVSLV